MNGFDCIVVICNYRKDGSGFSNELVLSRVNNEPNDSELYTIHRMALPRRKVTVIYSYDTEKP